MGPACTLIPVGTAVLDGSVGHARGAFLNVSVVWIFGKQFCSCLIHYSGSIDGDLFIISILLAEPAFFDWHFSETSDSSVTCKEYDMLYTENVFSGWGAFFSVPGCERLVNVR